MKPDYTIDIEGLMGPVDVETIPWRCAQTAILLHRHSAAVADPIGGLIIKMASKHNGNFPINDLTVSVFMSCMNAPL